MTGSFKSPYRQVQRADRITRPYGIGGSEIETEAKMFLDFLTVQS